ncbi:hypothetical protein ACIU1J_24355 [Azospirillum doebereinerae]
MSFRSPVLRSLRMAGSVTIGSRDAWEAQGAAVEDTSTVPSW